MQNLTSFINSGVIDIRAITTFGVSSKENDSAIGYFGTGLKYAIAVLLRNGCKVQIQAGKEIYNFSSIVEQVRVNSFEFITMNGEKLGFTTELGKNWELWQAYRELYCNCMDENGVVSTSLEAVSLEDFNPDNSTIVTVTGKEFLDIHNNNREIILQTKPIAVLKGLAIHPGKSSFIYYRGIKVYQLPKLSKFTYNILQDTKLTEDRTLADYWVTKYRMIQDIFNLKDTNIIKDIVTYSKDFLEGDFDFDITPNNVTDEFTEYCKELVKSRNAGISLSVLRYIKRTTDVEIDMYIDYTPNRLEDKAIAKAINFLEKLDYPVQEYKIRIVEDLGNGVLGQAKDETIFLSKILLVLGTKQIASCLLEEYIHLKFRFMDESRELQTYLFDKVISLGEQIVDDIL
jgi:hydroxymethylpyrimidine pyrophosphatase-like HAD family hydrolase